MDILRELNEPMAERPKRFEHIDISVVFNEKRELCETCGWKKCLTRREDELVGCNEWKPMTRFQKIRRRRAESKISKCVQR